MPEDLRSALARRVVIADGAMGTMLQSYDLGLDDFEQLEGCNEVLSVTRPDVVRAIHDAYFEAGVDAVETNTFGANLSALGEYDISHRITELAGAAARIARASADAGQHTRAAALGARQRRSGHEAADPGPRLVRPAAGRLPASRSRPCSPAASTPC